MHHLSQGHVSLVPPCGTGGCAAHSSWHAVGFGSGLARAYPEELHTHTHGIEVQKPTVKLQPLLPVHVPGKHRHNSAATSVQKRNLGGKPHFSQIKEMYFEFFYSG